MWFSLKQRLVSLMKDVIKIIDTDAVKFCLLLEWWKELFLLRFLKYFSFSLSGCKAVVDSWVCLGMVLDCYLEGGIYCLFRRENTTSQEDLILNYKELFPWTKSCLWFLDSCSFTHSSVTLPSEQCLSHDASQYRMFRSSPPRCLL